jgi:hypothetical protein
VSGPIVRKYGFPNFDKIFGAKPLEHGVEEPEQSVVSGQGQEAGPAAPKSEARERVQGSETAAPKTP